MVAKKIFYIFTLHSEDKIDIDMCRDINFPQWEKYTLFTGREVRIGKNYALGLEYGPRPDSSFKR